ncbi:hypothetical protein [Tannockella kyphosi]|uniref:hypothetical protein n=1 Tax=Tannockella kyphosi TaxID=2899121 RepID=UPI002010DEAD|nr:hypothetical protein [Tannockella kyphosi]
MKKTFNLICIAFMMVCLVGCSNSGLTYTFESADTGDTISVKFDTSDGYYLEEYDTESLLLDTQIFCVYDSDDTILSQATFVSSSDYSLYNIAISGDSAATLIDSSDEGNQYLFWSYDDSEFNYIILVEGSNTAIVLGNNVSQESAQECFERMTITLE